MFHDDLVLRELALRNSEIVEIYLSNTIGDPIAGDLPGLPQKDGTLRTTGNVVTRIVGNHGYVVQVEELEDSRAEIRISEDLLVQVHGICSIISNCSEMRPFPDHYAEKGLTVSEAKDLLRAVLASSTRPEQVSESMRDRLRVLMSHEPWPKVSVFGGEVRLKSLLTLFHSTAVAWYTHLAKVRYPIFQNANQHISNENECKEAIHFQGIQTAAASLAERLHTDLQYYEIDRRLKRYNTRVRRLSQYSGIAHEMSTALMRQNSTTEGFVGAMDYTIDASETFFINLVDMIGKDGADLAGRSFIEGVNTFHTLAPDVTNTPKDEEKWQRIIRNRSILNEQLAEMTRKARSDKFVDDRISRLSPVADEFDPMELLQPRKAISPLDKYMNDDEKR